MHNQPNNVLLPFMLPTQKQLRAAVAAIIRDIQRDHDETDQCTADRLGISIGTVRNARNETTDLSALTIAKIGAIYGKKAVGPYNALYDETLHASGGNEDIPLQSLAKAIAVLSELQNGSHKQRFDALPTLRTACTDLEGFIASIERLRIVA